MSEKVSYDYQANSRRSTVFSTKGVVCSSQPFASEAGLSILRAGGNAVDAAVAVAAALNVTEPCNCGIGGDVFALFYDAKSKTVKAINGSGRSPKDLSLEKVRAKGIMGKRIPNEDINGVTVPGAVAAWVDMLDSWGSGRLTRDEILKPAIDLAEGGFPVHQQCAFEWSLGVDALREASKGLGEDTYPFLLDGQAPRPGQIFSNPALASTFRRIASSGKEGYYQGEVAQALVDSIQSRGGFMTLEDLAEHQSEFVDALSYTYGEDGHTVWECRPNGSGLAALIAFGIIDALRETGVVDIAKIDPGSTQWYHIMIEALRLAFADAYQFVAEPRTYPCPVDQLLSKTYLRERAKLFKLDKAEAQYVAGAPMPSSDTVYFTTADSEGNTVSMIMSNYLGFGTGVVPKDCGFSLQSRGGGFVLEEGHPNCLEGGKRPYHTIIPAMVTKGQELVCSFGVMGGLMQPQGHVQVLCNMLHRKHHPQAALDAKRFLIGSKTSSDPGPPEFFNRTIAIEDGIPGKVIEELRQMGHDLEVIEGNDQVVFGKGQITWQTIDERTGRRVWAAGTDPRGDGVALSQL